MDESIDPRFRLEFTPNLIRGGNDGIGPSKLVPMKNGIWRTNR